MTAILLIAAAATVCVAAIALTVALLLALSAALGAAFAWGWTPVAAARYERRLRSRYEPLPPSQTSGRRHGRPQLDPAAVDSDAYWTAAREASAVAELPPTLVMPVMPVVRESARNWAAAGR